MQLTFRQKLLLTLNIASLGFILLIVMGEILTDRVAAQITTIEQRYVPVVELRPQLEATVDQLGRAFQDAVATEDEEAVTATAALRDEFHAKLAAAGEDLDPRTGAELTAAMNQYYDAATGVSLRLIRGEAGLEVVEAIVDMQQKLAQVRDILKEAEGFNKETLTATFRLVQRALRSADNLRLAMAIGCLIAVLALSFLLARDMLRSLSALTAGLLRFGQGQFDVPISMARKNDEFGAVAASANRMAGQIRDLLAERERKSQELEAANARLAVTNHELEAFSYSVSHDLRAPLRAIDGFSKQLQAEYGERLDGRGRHYLERVRAATQRMSRLIDDLLNLSRISRSALRNEPVDLSALAAAVVNELRAREPQRQAEVVIEPGMQAQGDPQMLTIALENLLGNAWKFTSKTPAPRIEFGRGVSGGQPVYFVRDNGAGFDMAHSDLLFGAFQRLHTVEEFEGTGIGLATVQRIMHRHGGKIWAEGKPGAGATLYFTLGGVQP